MEMLQTKLMKRSKVLSVVLTVFWVLTAAIGLYFVLLLLLSLRWGGDVTFAQHAAELGREVSSPDIADMTIGQLRLMLLISIPGSVFGVAIYLTGAKVFRSIAKTGEPFEFKTVGRLKTIAWLMVVNLLFSVVSWSILSSAGLDLQGGARSSLISILPSGIMYIIFFFALVSVFQYGAELQRLSDETL